MVISAQAAFEALGLSLNQNAAASCLRRRDIASKKQKKAVYLFFRLDGFVLQLLFLSREQCLKLDFAVRTASRLEYVRACTG